MTGNLNFDVYDSISGLPNNKLSIFQSNTIWTMYADNGTSNTTQVTLQFDNTNPSSNTLQYVTIQDGTVAMSSQNNSPDSFMTSGPAQGVPVSSVSVTPFGVQLLSQTGPAGGFGAESSLFLGVGTTLETYGADMNIGTDSNTYILSTNNTTLQQRALIINSVDNSYTVSNNASWSFNANGTINYINIAPNNSPSRVPGVKILGSVLTSNTTEQSFKVLSGTPGATNYLAVRTANNYSANNLAIVATSGLATMRPLDIISTQLNLNRSNTITVASVNIGGVYLISNPLTFADGTSQNTAGSSVANTIYLQNVNNYQNTQIQGLQGTNDSQNTQISGLQGVNDSQNNTLTAINQYSASAYAQANTNATNITSVNQYATSAYNQANVTVGVDATQNTRLNSIETINDNQNTTIGIIQGVDNYQNTQITAVNQFAQGAYSTANVGYNFVNSGGTVSGSVAVQGSISVTGNISFTGNVISQTITGNTGQFFGYSANGFNALYAGLPAGFASLPNEIAQFTASNNSYVQINQQNESGGSQATTDWIATANNGTDTTYYVDLGIAGSGYDNLNPNNSLGTSIFPNDSYLYAQGGTSAGPGGNLVIGTATANAIVSVIAGGVNSPNVVTKFAPNTVSIFVPLTFSDGTKQSTAGSSVANTIYLQNVNDTQNAAISIIQGVDLGQNATITAVNQFAQSAYNKANTGVSATIYSANTVIVANASGYLSNSNTYFTAANNTLTTPNLYVTNRVGFANSNNISVVYQVYNANTNSLDVIFG